MSLTLDSVNNNNKRTMTVALDPAQWSDWNGQVGTTELAAFTAAVQNVSTIGLSFGGGCFFENGVGAPNGGTFNLWKFSVDSLADWRGGQRPRRCS